MSGPKLQISRDEVYSEAIDQRMRQQTAVVQAQLHYSGGPAPELVSAGRSRFWMNAMVYMTLFGLVGGVVAWGLSEMVLKGGQSNLKEFMEYRGKRFEILDSNRKGSTSFDDVQSQIKALTEKYKSNPYVKLENNPNLSEEEGDRRAHVMLEHDKWQDRIVSGTWMTIIAVFIAAIVAMAEDCMGRNPRGILVNGSVGAFFGLLGGVLMAFFLNKLYNAILQADSDPTKTRQVVARAVGWAILGLFVGVGPGIVMKSWKKALIGVAGGLLGGAIGGGLFDPIYWWLKSDFLGRLVGITAIGLFTGISVSLIETAAKSGWLRVLSGLITGKQFVLYKNATCIGSSPQCEIYLFKDTQIGPRHAAIQRAHGSFTIEDMNSGHPTFVNGQIISRARLKTGDQIQIGATCLMFQERGKTK